LLTHKKGMRLNAIPEAEMQKEYPKTWGYLSRFESVLRKTGIFRRFFKATDPFYSIFNIGDYTFSTHKVVIREIADSLTAAVVGTRGGKPCIPDHKLVMVEARSADEAHFLCGVLNSAPARLFVGSYVLNTQFSTHILDLLAVPTFSKTDSTHAKLARLSAEAHEAAATEDLIALSAVEAEIDRVAARLWGLSEDDLAEIKRSLEEA
jgi:hypothetical protein